MPINTMLRRLNILQAAVSRAAGSLVVLAESEREWLPDEERFDCERGVRFTILTGCHPAVNVAVTAADLHELRAMAERESFSLVVLPGNNDPIWDDDLDTEEKI